MAIIKKKNGFLQGHNHLYLEGTWHKKKQRFRFFWFQKNYTVFIFKKLVFFFVFGIFFAIKCHVSFWSPQILSDICFLIMKKKKMYEYFQNLLRYFHQMTLPRIVLVNLWKISRESPSGISLTSNSLKVLVNFLNPQLLTPQGMVWKLINLC